MIRGLHYHERGQDDLFACLQGTARVVVLDRDDRRRFTEDIGDDNPVALYIPGHHAHGFEALTDLLFCLPRDGGVRPGRPRRARDPVGRPSRQAPMEHADTDPLGPGQPPSRPDHGRRRPARRARSSSAFAGDDVVALTRGDWDVRDPAPASLARPDLVLHAAAWTNVDGAEDDPQGAAEVNVGGTGTPPSSARRSSPSRPTTSSTVASATPYVESDSPNPLSAYGRTKLHGEAAAGEGAWIVRSSWLFGPTGHNFVRTMLRLGAERDEVAVVDDQRGSPTYVGHLAAATRELVDGGAPFGVWHVAADGDCTWADFAEAIFEEAGLDCRVRRITTAEFGARAPRPAMSLLRSEKGAPELPHWRDGLSACLAALDAPERAPTCDTCHKVGARCAPADLVGRPSAAIGLPTSRSSPRG